MKGEQIDKADKEITLTQDQAAKFQTAVKIGIYKELHRKGLLTDQQLYQLISFQKR